FEREIPLIYVRIVKGWVEADQQVGRREYLRRWDGPRMRERVQIAAVRVLRAEWRGDVHAHRVRRRGELPVVCQRGHLVVEPSESGAERRLAVAEQVPRQAEPRVEEREPRVHTRGGHAWIAGHQVALGQSRETARLDSGVVVRLAELRD